MMAMIQPKGVGGLNSTFGEMMMLNKDDQQIQILLDEYNELL